MNRKIAVQSANDRFAASTDKDESDAAALMRVNHAGEVAAQALYHGQLVFARDEKMRVHLQDAAADEQAHLDWCAQRVDELGATVSKLGPFWYWGSYSIGVVAGMAGDHWSLGFIKETEEQVVEHLQSHLEKLPHEDLRSREIVSNMITDEARHAENAELAGARELPAVIKQAMRAISKVMTSVSYRI